MQSNQVLTASCAHIWQPANNHLFRAQMTRYHVAAINALGTCGRALDAGEGEEGSVSYGKFRNFLILLPAANLGRDPSTAWFEAATIVPFGALLAPVHCHARSPQLASLAAPSHRLTGRYPPLPARQDLQPRPH